MIKSDPAYTKHPRRLQDVITAVQVLGNFQTATATTEKWQNRIGTPPVSATSWKKCLRIIRSFLELMNTKKKVARKASGSLTLWCLDEASNVHGFELNDGWLLLKKLQILVVI